jgi:hypothetical protein
VRREPVHNAIGAAHTPDVALEERDGRSHRLDLRIAEVVDADHVAPATMPPRMFAPPPRMVGAPAAAR